MNNSSPKVTFKDNEASAVYHSGRATCSVDAIKMNQKLLVHGRDYYDYSLYKVLPRMVWKPRKKKFLPAVLHSLLFCKGSWGHRSGYDLWFDKAVWIEHQENAARFQPCARNQIQCTGLNVEAALSIRSTSRQAPKILLLNNKMVDIDWRRNSKVRQRTSMPTD